MTWEEVQAVPALSELIATRTKDIHATEAQLGGRYRVVSNRVTRT